MDSMEHSQEGAPGITTAQAEWLNGLQDRLEALRDVEMDGVIKYANAASELLKTFPTSLEDQKKVIQRLDELWAPWMGQNVYVKGKISYPLQTEAGTERRDGIVWETSAVSNGYGTRILEQEAESGLYFAEVIHMMFVSSESIPENVVPGGTVAISASLNDVIIDSERITKQRALSWLNTLYPEASRQIDEKLKNSMSETEAVLALREFDIDSLVDTFDHLVRKSVEEYIMSQIFIDQEAPYILTGTGTMSRIDSETGKRIIYPIKDYASLVRISSVEVIPKYSEQHKDQQVGWQLGINATTLSEDRRQESLIFSIPLDAITKLESIRRVFHQT